MKFCIVLLAFIGVSVTSLSQSIAKNSGSTAKNWESLNTEATVAYQTGDYRKALEIFIKAKDQACKEFEKSNAHYLEAVGNLALLYNLNGNYGAAITECEAYLTLIEASFGKQNSDFATGVFTLGTNYHALGRYKEAKALYLESLKIRERVLGEDHVEYGSSLASLGAIYFSVAEYDSAELYLEAALSVFTRSVGKANSYYVDALARLSNVYQTEGDFVRAEPLCLEALLLAEQIAGKDHPFYSVLMSNLAALYRDMGNYSKAEPIYLEALAMVERSVGKDHSNYATAANNLAVLYDETGVYDKAEVLYLDALRIWKKILGEEHSNYIQALSNLGVLYNNQQKFAEAETINKQVLTLAERVIGKDKSSYALYLNNLASSYALQKKYREAEPLFVEATQLWGRVFGKTHPYYSQLIMNQAIVYKHLHDIRKSTELFLEMNATLLDQLYYYFPSLSEKEREAFYDDRVYRRIQPFNTFVTEFRKENPALIGYMYNNQLAIKGILFQTNNKIRKRILASTDTNLINTFNKIQAKRDTLARAYTLSLLERKQAGIVLEDMEDEINRGEKYLSLQSQLFAKANDRQQFSWKDVQNKLTKNEAAIEIVHFNRSDSGSAQMSYAILIVTKNSLRPEFIVFENGNELNNKWLRIYRNSINVQLEDTVSYDQYWAPIAGTLKRLNKKIKKIYVSLDGVYNLINLNTLKSPVTKRFVADDFDIHFVTSTKDIITRQNFTKTYGKVSLIGFPDYAMRDSVSASERPVALAQTDSIKRFFTGGYIPALPGTEKEIDEIARLLQQSNVSPDIYKGAMAQKEVIKKLRNNRIIHIATHGFFRKDLTVDIRNAYTNSKIEKQNPLLNSGLLLAGAQQTFDGNTREGTDNGILTALEAANLDLDSTELVVLSACETGLGKLMNGEGVYGLQHAFQTAGAKSVLMSLWKVDDRATQELMIAFYKNFLQSGNKRKAFAEAQRLIRAKYPHPYYWGAFVLVGE